MKLQAAIRALAERPASIRARVNLALVLDQLGVPAATSVWACTARLAARRGHFVAAVTLCRRYLRGALARDISSDLAELYSAERVKGDRRPPPVAAPLNLTYPADDAPRAAWIDLALEMGCNIDWLCPPKDQPLPEIPFFGALSRPTFIHLIEGMEEAPFREGQPLLVQGGRESHLYFLAQGGVRIERQEPDGRRVVVAKAPAPAILGEMSMLTALPHRADVVADGTAVAWRISGDALLKTGAVGQELTSELSNLIKHRLLVNLLQHSPLFQGISDPTALLGAFELRSYQPGLIFKAGEEAPGLFVLLHGQAEVWSGDDETRVAVLGEGDAFGEISLLSGGKTTATVRLPEGGVLLHLSPDSYAALGAQREGLEEGLSELGGIRRGQLKELHFAGDFEDIDDGWLLEEV